MQSVFLVNLSFHWARHRFGSDEFWLASDVHLWLWHGSPRTVYLACLCQAMVFLAKGAWSYICGYPFAHIRSQFRLAPPPDAHHSDCESTKQTAFMGTISSAAFATYDLEEQEICSTPSTASTSSTDQTQREGLRGEVVCLQPALARAARHVEVVRMNEHHEDFRGSGIEHNASSGRISL